MNLRFATWRRAAELPAVEETGLTFEENAILKAVETSKHFPGLVVGDDSGLEVDALDGAPGIYSARYAGEHATDAENVAKLLRRTGRLRCCGSPLSARFRCALALAQEGKVLGTFEGVVEGRIVERTSWISGIWIRSRFRAAGLRPHLCRTFFGREKPDQPPGACDPGAPDRSDGQIPPQPKLGRWRRRRSGGRGTVPAAPCTDAVLI